MLNKETIDFVAAHRHEDPRTLALQAKRYPAVEMQKAVTQIEGWQTAERKLPTWAATDGIIFPPRISMEQCSSEETANYKSNLVTGESIADLTGGFGIDCSFMARGFKSAFYIERNPLLCDIARHNFKLLGLGKIEIIYGDSQEIIPTLPALDWIFIDPARRDSDGRKVVALSDCEPDVTALEEQMLQKARRVMIKCSPMFDIKAACRQLAHVNEVHVVAVNNECKELLIILDRESNGDLVTTKCINIRKDAIDTFCFKESEEREKETKYSSGVGKFLYEPNAAIQKSGCHATLTDEYNIGKLHPNSQLYTSDNLVEQFPGRIFTVERVCGFTKGEIKEIQALKQANITVRNFPESVASLRKKLKLADGGDRYIFATTSANNNRVLLLCKKA